MARRRLLDVGHARRVVAQTLCQRDHAEQRVVVRVQERADRQPGLLAVVAVEAPEQLDRLVGGERVLDRARVVLAESVRLGADPLREAVVVEQIGLQVLLDVLLDRVAVIVDREQVALAVVGVEVGVGGVPLALVVRPVAAGPEPVAERRHGVRREPEHVLAVGSLRQPVGLRHAVQRRVLARQQRRAARRARRRHRIVVRERDARLPQALLPGHMLAAKARQLLGLVHRRVAQLVGEHQQDVRASHGGGTIADHPGPRPRRAGPSPRSRLPACARSPGVPPRTSSALSCSG